MSWEKIEDSTPPDGLHIRGLWVRRLVHPEGHVMEWQFSLGLVNDDGEFVTPEGDDTGWSADDYSHWLRVDIPEPPAHNI